MGHNNDNNNDNHSSHNPLPPSKRLKVETAGDAHTHTHTHTHVTHAPPTHTNTHTHTHTFAAVAKLPSFSEDGPLDKVQVDHGNTYGTYRSLVGAVLWVAAVTRIDIQLAVSLLTQHVHQPTTRALTTVKRVLRFLKATQDECLTFEGAELQLIGQCDASWGNHHPTRRSYHGFSFSPNGGAISWPAKLQPIVALSTVEAEYIALCVAAQEATWLRKLCKFLRVPIDSATPTVISQDK